jgi:hypothetical protein
MTANNDKYTIGEILSLIAMGAFITFFIIL